MNNIKIGVKLIGGFLIVAIVAGVIGVFGITNLKKLSDADTKLFVSSTKPLDDVISMLGFYQRSRVNTRDMVRAPDVEKIKYFKDRTDMLLDSVTLAAETYEKTLLTEEGKKLFIEFETAFKTYHDITENVADLALQGKKDLAYALIDTDMKKASDEVQKFIYAIADQKITAAQNMSDDNTKTANATIMTLLIVLIIGIIIAIALGIFLSLSITGPLQKGVAMMQEMALGHLGTRLRMARKDEIGVLATAMDDFSEDLQKNVVATVIKIGEGDLSTDLKPKDGQDEITPAVMNTTVAIRNLISEANALSKAAVEGRLATRGDTTKYKGGYREIVKGVNDCLDSVIGPLNVAADYVDKISKGNIPTKITDTYNGDFNILKNNLNTCIEAVNSLVADAGMLSNAAVEGKLATRADTSKHFGDYKKIVQGVNDCLDSVIGPLNVAADYVDKISKGNIPAKITDNYNGDFNSIKNNLNQCIDAVNNLVADAGILAKAAVEGKLATRADASKHSGDFRKIVQGVDDCLDAVIGPLNVTAKYVDDISKGVIPPIITDNYNGDFNIIKGNLNTVVKMMSDLLKETDVIIKAAEAGELDKRANAALFQGGWNQLVSGVNDTITNIVNPLMVTADYVDKVSKGVIPPEITTIYKGQYNIIKNNLNAVVKMMSDLLKETDVIIKAAADGELDKRANAALFLGGWNQLVSGVNDTITNIVGPLMVTADYVDKVSQGVIPPEITTIYKGQYNVIKNNLNAVVKMMSDLLKETDVIIKAAADGELDKRANATLFKGGWNQLVNGVNDTITNIVNPLMVTAEYVDKVSKGVIPLEITTVYKGQYNIIKNNLNAVVKMMSDLLKESDTLVQAALGGALNTRAKADLFIGGWNELMTGINKTLDAVLEPINEAAGVLEKVAARDMTARVKGDYKGDHAKIKISLNSAVDNLDTALTQVAEATEQVSSGSQQISAGSQSLAQGANEQASSLEEVSSSLEEMSSMTKQNAENANQANNLAAEANTNAAQGGEAMKRMSSSINKIKESSDQTAKIVKTIDEIAMQTNLLALNAAVEAARAGEAGRGFAVVAEEVRNLAQRSAEAAKNTANMIEESVKNAEEGVTISVEVSKSFDSIAGSVKKVNDLIAEIAAASQEQSQGIDQVNNAVAQMDKVTQQNAANSEESASAAEEMSSQAEELQSMIAQFMLSQAQQRSAGPAMHQVKSPSGTGANNHSPVQHAAPVAHKNGNGNGKKHLKAPEFAMAGKKAHADQLIPMDDEVLKQF